MRVRPIGRFISIFAAAIVLPTVVCAENGPLEPEPDVSAMDQAPKPDWKVRLTAGAWMARLGTHAELDNDAGIRLDLDRDLDLRDLQATFNAELDIRLNECFDLHLSGFSFSTDSSGTFEGVGAFGDVTLSNGDRFRSSFDMTSVNGEVRLALYRPLTGEKLPRNSDQRRRAELRFGPLLGARYLDVDHTVEHVGVSRDRGSGQWLAIHGGAHFEIMFRPELDTPWFDRFSLDAAASAGPVLGGDGGFAWQVQTSFRVYFNDYASLLVGYRMVDMSAEDGSYEFEGGVQGLFVGGSVGF